MAQDQKKKLDPLGAEVDVREEPSLPLPSKRGKGDNEAPPAIPKNKKAAQTPPATPKNKKAAQAPPAIPSSSKSKKRSPSSTNWRGGPSPGGKTPSATP